MNERLKALCTEAFTKAWESQIGPDGQIKFDDDAYIFYKIFAELIVRECAGIVADAVDHREPASTYVGKIKQHFGVE